MDSNTKKAENSKWLAENLTEMDNSIKRMLELIEENDESSTVHHQNKPELIAGFQEFQLIYKSLANRYNHLTQELLNDDNPSGFKLQGSENYDSPLTPNGSMDLRMSGRKSVSFSPGSGSSDASPNADTESYSSDSETESFYSSLNNYLVSPVNTGSQGLKKNEKLTGEESVLKVGERRSYKELMGKIIKYEEELRVTNLKLQVSEQEVAKLKKEFEKSESAVALAEKLRAQLETAQDEIDIREVDVEMEKRKVFELQKRVLDLETKLSESNSEIKKLVVEHEAGRESLEASDKETLKLKEALYDCQQNFSMEKAKMQTDITSLSEKQTFLETQLQELESHGKLLEDRIKESEAKKMEMKATYVAKEVQWQGEINRLKADTAVRAEHVEILNKDFDKHKVKYDMLMAEKDRVSAKVDNLTAELTSRDNQIREMEEKLIQLCNKHKELVCESGSEKKLVDELRVRVQEVEKEVEKQRIVILEAEEEKREAIRQLCFSLDHYRSGYRQLVRSLSGHKRQAVGVS